jgi:hypothetical protein
MSVIMNGAGATATRLKGSRMSHHARRIARGLVCAAVMAIALAAFGPASGALASLPPLTIESPKGGSVLNTPTPTFAGTTGIEEEEPLDVGWVNRVIVFIHIGTEAGPVAQVLSTDSTIWYPTWSAATVQPLPPGSYTAEAVQSEVKLDDEAQRGKSSPSHPVAFTVDTVAPAVTLTSPADGSTTTLGSQVFSGAAGTAEGDQQAVTVQLFAGSSIGSQPPLAALTVPAANGGWSATFGGLSPGTYTARAQQLDEALNVGTSAPVTFTVSTPATTVFAPPLASFKWFPAKPVVGEPVSLVSSSTDESSPIVGYSWALTSTGSFTVGKQVLTTTFATPGDHLIRLRVTGADGLSSVASEIVHVSPLRLGLMAPFPVVRIAGSVTSGGVDVGLLTVQAPIGARVRVTCRGRGCPTASESRVAASSSKKRKPSMVTIDFRRFETRLAAGAVLEIRIYKHGLIGKYTRFMIRRGRIPVRVDSCIGQAGLKPVACPS